MEKNTPNLLSDIKSVCLQEKGITITDYWDAGHYWKLLLGLVVFSHSPHLKHIKCVKFDYWLKTFHLHNQPQHNLSIE